MIMTNRNGIFDRLYCGMIHNSNDRFTGTKLTCDADFGRPLGGSIEYCLLGCLQMAGEVLFGDVEHLLDRLKNFRTVLLPYLHALLHSHDDILSFVLCTMFGALLHSP